MLTVYLILINDLNTSIEYLKVKVNISVKAVFNNNVRCLAAVVVITRSWMKDNIVTEYLKTQFREGKLALTFNNKIIEKFVSSCFF